MLRVHNPAGGSAVTAAQVFRGATAETSGRSGLVPGPAAGQENMVLLGTGLFGRMSASACFVYDRYNVCGEGINTLVTLQDWCNAVMLKVQSRTVFNFNDDNSGEGSGSSPSSDPVSIFEVEHVVDTYGLVGNAGTTVTAGELAAALADTQQTRTLWRQVTDSEPVTPVTPGDNEEEETEPQEEQQNTPEANEEEENPFREDILNGEG